jgi:hypothetical protein
MSRKYDGATREDASSPPPRRPGGADTHGLGPRHWRLLELLAEHGELDTGQVTTLMFGSRPAAVRHLRALLRAGLVWRSVSDRDRTHLALYEISIDGVRAVRDRLRQAGQPVPPALGTSGFDQPTVVEFFTLLVADARSSGGDRHLYRWRRHLDTAAWLRQAGVHRVRPAAFGVWIEHGTVVRFLLHLDHDEPSTLLGTPARPPSAALAGYRRCARGVPVTVVLVLCRTGDRERQLHCELADNPIPVTVAVTTEQRLYAALSPADAIWTRIRPPGDPTAEPTDPTGDPTDPTADRDRGPAGHPDRLLRLVDLARP